MKAKIYLGCLLALSLATTSCSDFLDEDPKGRLSELNYPKDKQDLEGAVNAMFTQINKDLAGAHAYANSMMGDDVTAFAGGNKDVFRQFDVFSVNDNNGDNQNGWASNYRIIKAANFIIERADKADRATQDEIDVAKGQAYFWRAYCYFRLVRWYGEVPLILETPINYKAEKATIAEIYAQIEKDLDDALKLVPDGYKKAPMITEGLNNYANKGAVQAVQAAVYMGHAGYPLNGGKEYYQKAAAAAKAVIDGVNAGTYYYKLEPNYADRFKYITNNNTKEIVVGVKYSRFNINWGWDGLSTQLGVAQGFAVNGGWADVLGELKFFADMPEGPRKDVLYGNDGGKILVQAKDNPKKGEKIDWYDEMVVEQHPMFRNLMYGDVDGQRADYNSDTNMRVEALTGQTLRNITYSEVLLWYAESVARTGQVDALAKECLKQVVDRAYGAGKVNVEALAADPQKFAEKCWMEHGYEVAGYIPAFVTRANDQLRMDRLKDNLAARIANKPVVVGGKSLTEPVAVVEQAWNDSRNYGVVPNKDAVINSLLVSDKK